MIDIFLNYKKMPQVEAPCLIMHGTADGVVPCSNGRRLHKTLQHPVKPLWLEGRGHNDMPPDRVHKRVRAFLLEAEQANAHRAAAGR